MLQHATLVRPTEDWQVREWCRIALRRLLAAMGTEEFEAELLNYLQTITGADRVAGMWTAPENDPRISGFGEDRDYTSSVCALPRDCGTAPRTTLVRRTALTADFAAAKTMRHLQAMDLQEEFRMVVPLSGGREFLAFLGHASGAALWDSLHTSRVGRAVELLHSIIVAHDRCRGLPAEETGEMPSSGHDRLAQLYAQRGLTARERDIAARVVAGYSTLAIAMALEISENTVKVHRKHLYQKLGVRSKAELFGLIHGRLSQQ